jgi:hypothetical protein
LTKGLRSFTILSLMLLILIISVMLALLAIYLSLPKSIYDNILLIPLGFLLFYAVFFMAAFIAILYTYKYNSVNDHFLWLVKHGLDFFLPILISLSGFFKLGKDPVCLFYIHINNILVQSIGEKVAPSELLLLLPGCLQNPQCQNKVSADIANCERCGYCHIGLILGKIEGIGITPVVVAGGTAARSIVKDKRPKFIMAVACERELASGIADVEGIPIIGLLNKRPHGPCNHTTVDVNNLVSRLENILLNK